MKRFNLSPEAAQDIREIWSYIAKDNPRAARNVRLKFFQLFQTLAQRPFIGHRREDLTDKPVLFWPVGSYLIVYHPYSKPIEIVRVLHSALDLSRLLDD